VHARALDGHACHIDAARARKAAGVGGLCVFVTAYEALAGRKGAVLVSNYKTGEILCMASGPSIRRRRWPLRARRRCGR